MEVSHAYPAYLSESQMERISPFFPRSHSIPRVDDRRVVSGILYVSKWTSVGRILLRNMVGTRRCTINLSDGATSVFSAEFSPSWQTKRPLMAR